MLLCFLFASRHGSITAARPRGKPARHRGERSRLPALARRGLGTRPGARWRLAREATKQETGRAPPLPGCRSYKRHPAALATPSPKAPRAAPVKARVATARNEPLGLEGREQGAIQNLARACWFSSPSSLAFYIEKAAGAASGRPKGWSASTADVRSKGLLFVPDPRAQALRAGIGGPLGRSPSRATGRA